MSDATKDYRRMLVLILKGEDTFNRLWLEVDTICKRHKKESFSMKPFLLDLLYATVMFVIRFQREQLQVIADPQPQPLRDDKQLGLF